MPGQEIVDPWEYVSYKCLGETRNVRTMGLKTFVNLRVIRYLSIVVLRPVQPVVGDIQRDGVVPRLGNPVPVVF